MSLVVNQTTSVLRVLNSHTFLKRRRLVLSLVEHNIIMSWNCQEHGNHSAVQVLADLVRSKGPIMLFLMETKLSMQEMIPIRDELGYRSMLAIPSVRRSGGLAMLWTDDVMVNTDLFP